MAHPPNHTAQTEARVPPQAVEVEKAVLGSMMIEQEAAGVAVQMLAEDDFYKPAHRSIYQTLLDLYDQNAPLDLLSVEEELRDQGALEKTGGGGYLTECTRSVSSAANIDYHAQIIKEKSKKRQVIQKCTDVTKEAFRSDSDVYDVLDQWGKGVDELTLGNAQSPARTVAESLPETLDHIDAARKNPSHITGVACGLDVDSWTNGWQPGDLIVIASRPSMGKTGSLITMSRNMITNPNAEHRMGVLCFSLEMPRRQYVQRILAQESRLDNENLRAGKVKDQEFKNLCTVTAPKLHDQDRTATMLIDDTPGLSLRVMRSKVRSYLRKHADIGVVMIDYLQLMDAHAGKGDTTSQKIGYITRGLKSLAKELNIPIILYSQLSRAVETRGGDKRPQLSDLRESGDIEQDADIVIFIYRPEYYGIDTDTYGNQYPEQYAEFIIGKQRNGPVGTVPLYFKEEYTLFGNRADSWAEETLNAPASQEATQMGIDDEEPF